MSKIISDQTGIRGISHIVQTEDGKQYVVACADFEPGSVLCNSPYELAVFRWNQKAKAVTNWTDLYVRRYNDESEMLHDFDSVCNDLETYLTQKRRISA